MDALTALADQGYVLLPDVLSAAQVADVRTELARALHTDAAGPIRSAGGVYAARNVLTLWPASATVWRVPPLVALMEQVLGPGFGVVRGLFFDKPPGQTWALPWHQDLTIAVREHRPSTSLCKPTTKAGVPHMEASVAVLEQMLTLRLHLDDVTAENGPLQVLPGSHRHGKGLDLRHGTPLPIYASAGSVLLMRPLLAHSSGRSHEQTHRHRRILHLELASAQPLPDGVQWQQYLRISGQN